MPEANKLLVGPEGSLDAKIVIVGEAPGRDEVIQRRPFVGEAGRELNRFLSSAKLTRSDCYITNVIKERPPNNDISKFIVFPKSAKQAPSITPAYLEYEKQLFEELSKVKANVIVPMGNTALYALTRQRGIEKYRGSILSNNKVGRVAKVIPTIHPAAALPYRGNYQYRRFIVHDLMRIKLDSAFPELRLPKRDLRIKPTFDEIISYIDYCKSADYLGFDIEVINQEVSHLAISPSSEEAMSIPFLWDKTNYLSDEEEADVWIALAKLLQNPKITKIAQYGTFDATFVFSKYGIRPFPMEDTHIQHSILYPELPRDLGFLCSIYTREPYYKDDGKVWKEGTFDDEDFSIYNAKDAAVLHQIFHRVEERLIKQGNLEVYRTQRDLIPPIVYMTSKGIRVDKAGMEAHSKRAKEILDDLEFQIEQATEGIIANPASAQQVMNYFYIHKGVKPYLKKGRPTGDEDALKRLAKPTSTRQGYPEARLILDHRYHKKLKGTYLDMRLDKDGRLRSAINPGKTVSGRLASKKTIFDTGADIQNQHSEMKPYILSDKGYILCKQDLSQAENRIVAYIAPEPSMIEAFENDVDIHAKTGALISGLDVEEVLRQHREDITCPLGNGQQTWRYWGKKGNHGVDYGEGFKTFALKNELTEPESKFVLNRIHTVYPGIRKYHQWVTEKLRRDKTLKNCFGRSRAFTGELNDDTYRKGFNFIPQSTVGYKINRHGVLYIYENYERFVGLELLNQVHDDIWFQFPLSLGTKVLAETFMELHRSLSQPLSWRGREFSIPTDVSFGFNLKDMKEVKMKHISSVSELSKIIKGGIDEQREG